MAGPPKFIYVFDVLCPWCYAFHAELERSLGFLDAYALRMVSGGLFTGKSKQRFLDMAPAYDASPVYRSVMDFGQAVITEKYFDGLILGQDYFMDSERTSYAFQAFRLLGRSSLEEMDFLSCAQKEMFVNGTNPNSDAFYERILRNFDVDVALFLAAMKDRDTQQKAHADMDYARALKARSYPSLFLEASDDHYYLLAKGYTQSQELIPRMQRVLDTVYPT